MFDRALGTFDIGERKQLINDIERELFREMPALPTVSRSGTMGSWDYVMGFAPHGLWYHGRHLAVPDHLGSTNRRSSPLSDQSNC